MSENRDELRGRMRDLARQAEQTSAPGLVDVHHRRARRQRNTMLATGLAVVAVLGSTALFLNPFGDTAPSIQPVGPGPTTSIEAPAQTTDPVQTTEPAQTTTEPAQSTGGGSSGQASPAGDPSGPTAGQSGGETSTPSPGEPGDQVLAIDLGSLVTAEELDAAGVSTQGDSVGDADGQPTLPPMCTASSWQEQHSGPSDRVSDGYVIDGGQVVMDLLGYPSAFEANAALVKLKEDARACPVVFEFLTVSVTAVGSAIGDEFVVFAMDSESGEDGSVERIWVTIARVDNVLVAATLDRDPGYAGDVSGDEALSRTAAEANVAHIEAG